MKKTLNINLSGLVFTLDEDAYSVLNNYLEAIAKHFQNEAGKEEIIADIESRFAEEFSQKRTRSKEVMSTEDVNAIIATLGMVEDFSSEKESSSESKSQDPSQTKQSAARRLYRDTDNAILGGVASGIATYFGIDPVVIRVVFVVFTFAWGFAIPLYLLFWFITPKAETAAQKAEMKGEALTLKAIEEHVKNVVNEGKEKLNSLEKKNTTQRLNGFFHEIGRSLKNIFTKFFSIFGSIIGFFMTLAAFLGIIFLGIASGIVIVHRHAPELGIQIYNYISATEFFLGVIFFSAVFLFPLFGVLLLGIRLLKKRPTFNGYLLATLIIFWGMSLIGSGILISKVAPQINKMYNERVDQERGEKKIIHPEITAFDTLLISGAYTVEIQPGKEFSLTATGYEGDLQDLNVKMQDKELDISKNHRGFCIFCFEDEVHLVLTAPTSSYNKLELNGANTIMLNHVTTDTFTLTLDGANRVEGTLDVQQLNLESEGVNTITLVGTATSGKFKISGASHFEGFHLVLQFLDITLNGVAKAEVQVQNTIEGKIEDVATIEFMGTPKKNNLHQRNEEREENILLPEIPQEARETTNPD